MSLSYKIYIIAGEPSGDFIGSRLIKQLKAMDHHIEIKGIGGSLMAEQGVISLFKIKHISVMGFLAIIPRLFKLFKLVNRTVKDIVKFKPDALVTIDSPGFNLAVVTRIKKLNRKSDVKTKLIHYVAPTVWAYKAKRSKKFAKIFDCLLCILPFEPKYFLKEGLDTHFVGHPILESGSGYGIASRFSQKHKLKPTDINLVLLPGSRSKEVRNSLKMFLAVADGIVDHLGKKVNIIIPTIDTLELEIKKQSSKHNVIITTNTQDKYDSFKLADLAFATSGTVSLELAMAKTPTIICYKLNKITEILKKLLIKVDYISILNIMANKEIIPELVGKNFNRQNLLSTALDILSNNDTISDQSNDRDNFLRHLIHHDKTTPSVKAAGIIMKEIKQTKGLFEI